MGNLLSYPLGEENVTYHRPCDYNAFGERKQDVKKEENEIDLLHRSHCEEIFAQRRSSKMRKTFLTDVSNEDYAKRFPQWSSEDIGDYKIQFEIFDLNRDGVIDFKEMNSVLDEFGEFSDPEDRRRCFTEMDVDDSGTIDFEEFLQVMVKLLESGREKNAERLSNIVTRGAHHVAKLRRMSVYKQLTNGLF